MLTYHNEPGLKASLVQRMKDHEAAGTLETHSYSTCFIGCLDSESKGILERPGFHPSELHNRWPDNFGLPIWLAYWGEFFFSLSTEPYRRGVCSRFLDAIPVGVELDDSLASIVRYGINGKHGYDTTPANVDILAERFLQLLRAQEPALERLMADTFGATTDEQRCVVADAVEGR